MPVRLDTFSAYGLAFRDRMVPELEDKLVVRVERVTGGFLLQLEDGETFEARRVVLAVGITHFEYVPENLAHLPPQFLSHSARHREVEPFRGRNVVVIGGGASALDLAGLLHEAGAEVQLVSRREELKFHSQPMGKPRSQWQQIRHPQSGLGPGMRSRFFANAPGLFYYLPERLRLEAVRRSLGPSGGWFIRDKVVGKVPLHLGCTPQGAEVKDGRVHLSVQAADGSKREIVTEHVIAATGYRVDLERLKFLNARDPFAGQDCRRISSALVDFRVVDTRPLLRGGCGGQQLRPSHEVRVWGRFRRSHADSRAGEVSRKRAGIGSGAQRSDYGEVK